MKWKVRLFNCPTLLFGFVSPRPTPQALTFNFLSLSLPWLSPWRGACTRSTSFSSSILSPSLSPGSQRG
ncbi:hypothetical protein OIU76_030534 [Salix suchowensis]|nr:hypothetical protein OIU76_030534 [Salix suchowensis]